jgi:hypothetical protein
MELCQASFACWNFNVVPRFGPVAQESLADSALLNSPPRFISHFTVIAIAITHRHQPIVGIVVR